LIVLLCTWARNCEPVRGRIPEAKSVDVSNLDMTPFCKTDGTEAKLDVPQQIGAVR
jgi:hypothetical protein